MWRKWWNVFLAKIWIQDYLDHHYHRRYHAWKRPTTRMPFVMVKLAFLKTNDCAFYGIQLRQDVVLLKEGNFDLTRNALEIAVRSILSKNQLLLYQDFLMRYYRVQVTLTANTSLAPPYYQNLNFVLFLHWCRIKTKQSAKPKARNSNSIHIVAQGILNLSDSNKVNSTMHPYSLRGYITVEDQSWRSRKIPKMCHARIKLS